MSVDMSCLEATHQAQMQSYLKFFIAKRKQSIDGVTNVFADCRELKLQEDMYSQQDVSELLDSLLVDIKSNLATDLELYSHQSVLFLKQLFLQAEGHDITMKVDTFILDDERLLSNIRDMEDNGDLLSDGPKFSQSLGSKNKKLKKLAPMSGSGSGSVDVKLLQQVKDLRRQNESLQSRFAKLQVQCRAALKENAELKADVQQVQSGSAASLADHEAVDRVQLLQAELDNKQRQCDALHDQLQGKVNKSKQFQELMKLVQKKNALIKSLRAQIDTSA